MTSIICLKFLIRHCQQTKQLINKFDFVKFFMGPNWIAVNLFDSKDHELHFIKPNKVYSRLYTAHSPTTKLYILTDSICISDPMTIFYINKFKIISLYLYTMLYINTHMYTTHSKRYIDIPLFQRHCIVIIVYIVLKTWHPPKIALLNYKFIEDVWMFSYHYILIDILEN